MRFHNLQDLAKVLRSKGIQVNENQGWFLDTDMGRFTMYDDVLYLNKIKFNSKEFLKD